MKRYLIVLGLLATIVVLGFLLKASQQQQQVLVNNNKALTVKTTTYKAKDGRQVSKSIVMQSTKKNLTDSELHVSDNMKISRSKIETIGSIISRVDTTVEAPATITTVITPTGDYTRDTCYNFTVNPEFTASVCVRNDTARFHPVITDSLFIVFASEKVFVNKRKTFFIARWLQKRQTVVTANVLRSNDAIKTINESFTYIIK